MANLNNFMFKVKDYNKNKSNNIVNSNITFNEYADKWLKEYRLPNASVKPLNLFMGI